MANMKQIVLEMTSVITSDSEDIQMIVGRALQDTVAKLGDQVLPMLLPLMTAGLENEEENDVTAREGLCLGLAEIFSSLTKRQYTDHHAMLLPALEKAVCDPCERVRSFPFYLALSPPPPLLLLLSLYPSSFSLSCYSPHSNHP